MNHENLYLSKGDDLKKACEAVRESRSEWKAKIATFLQDVQNTDEETRVSLEFQKKLWNGSPIIKSKRGNINVDSVIREERIP